MSSGVARRSRTGAENQVFQNCKLSFQFVYVSKAWIFSVHWTISLGSKFKWASFYEQFFSSSQFWTLTLVVMILPCLWVLQKSYKISIDVEAFLIRFQHSPQVLLWKMNFILSNMYRSLLKYYIFHCWHGPITSTNEKKEPLMTQKPWILPVHF